MCEVSSTNFKPPFRIVRAPAGPAMIRFPSMTIVIPSQTCASVTVQSPGVKAPVRAQFWAAAGGAMTPSRAATKAIAIVHTKTQFATFVRTEADIRSPPSDPSRGGAVQREGHSRDQPDFRYLYLIDRLPF